jgi:immunity protein 57 of polymorphic toxin system
MNTMRTFSIIFLGLVCLQASSARSSDLDMEGRQLRMADQTVLMRIMVAVNPRSQYLCTENKFACFGGDPGELAVALIAARDTPRSRSALVRLVRFKLDAGYGEDFSCHILTKGKSVRSLLSKANPDNLRMECEADFKKLIESHGDMFEGLTADQVCAKSDSIRTQIADLVTAIDQKQPCPF